VEKRRSPVFAHALPWICAVGHGGWQVALVVLSLVKNDGDRIHTASSSAGARDGKLFPPPWEGKTSLLGLTERWRSVGINLISRGC